jgi:hypothetical protein
MLDPAIHLPLNEAFHLRAIRSCDTAAWYACLSLPEVYRPTSWNLQGMADLQEIVTYYQSPAAERGWDA